VAFERKPVPGFYDTGEEARATKEMQQEFRPTTVEEMEGKRRKVWHCCSVWFGGVAKLCLACVSEGASTTGLPLLLRWRASGARCGTAVVLCALCSADVADV
jgi:hypothetical protein